jgi:hypothetical protein
MKCMLLWNFGKFGGGGGGGEGGSGRVPKMMFDLDVLLKQE